MSTYYNSIYNSDPLYNWKTKESFIASLVTVWLEWWPTKKYQNKQQLDSWILANPAIVQSLGRQASEVVDKCIALGLINF
jgi:hypothetical protein